MYAIEHPTGFYSERPAREAASSVTVASQPNGMVARRCLSRSAKRL